MRPIPAATMAASDSASRSMPLPNQADPESGRAFPVAASIPEPESYAMMLAGLGLLGFFARRKKQQTT